MTDAVWEANGDIQMPVYGDVPCRWRFRRPPRGLPLLAFLVIAYTLCFVYPTRWRYDHLGVTPIRTCRVTGHMQFATLNGWVDQIPVK